MKYLDLYLAKQDFMSTRKDLKNLNLEHVLDLDAEVAQSYPADFPILPIIVLLNFIVHDV